MTYAFTFDTAACSGCKACQAACKDKNHLPIGVLWRRVYEVAGGGWKREGAAWNNTVFAYNISVSCNHCEHPKCAGVCPVDAYTIREDGIVLLDSSRCVGCRYCEWACPYGAPQYDRTLGHMTKCNFCNDNLEMGLPPACVAACPLRVLNFNETINAKDKLALWEIPAKEHPYPLPGSSHTGPHLAIKPHSAMKSTEEKFIANLEEIRPQKESGREETPLVAFTLLVQMAVGGFWAMLWMFHGPNQPALWLIGLCLGAGTIASFAHLGRKRNAWRMLAHLRKSWLSREILFTILFGAGWLMTLMSTIMNISFPLFYWITALIGLRLIDCMGMVYRLASIPAWNSWRTNVRFFLSAALLGTLVILPLWAMLRVPALPWIQIGIMVSVFMIVLAEETRERWLFYQARIRSKM